LASLIVLCRVELTEARVGDVVAGLLCEVSVVEGVLEVSPDLPADFFEEAEFLVGRDLPAFEMAATDIGEAGGEVPQGEGSLGLTRE